MSMKVETWLSRTQAQNYAHELIPEGHEPFPLPKSAEEKVCVTLCGSVANIKNICGEQ